MARTIVYQPKSTASTAEYREITPDDLADLLARMQHWLTRMAAEDNRRDADWQAFRDIWWHRRDTNLPKSRRGPNTPASAIAGILENFLYAEPAQRDLTAPQCDIIERVSAVLAEAFPDIEAVRFQRCLFG